MSLNLLIILIILNIFLFILSFLPSRNFFNNWISIIIYFNIRLYLVSNKKLILK